MFHIEKYTGMLFIIRCVFVLFSFIKKKKKTKKTKKTEHSFYKYALLNNPH